MMKVNAIHRKGGAARVSAAQVRGDSGPRILAKIGPKWLRIMAMIRAMIIYVQLRGPNTVFLTLGIKYVACTWGLNCV